MFTNWKTTAAGIGLGLVAVGHLLTGVGGGSIDAGQLVNDLMGIFGAAGLIAAKDANVTGGTVKQPS